MPNELSGILSELKTIRELLKWQKTHLLEREAREQADKEQAMADAIAVNNAAIEKARAASLAVGRQLHAEANAAREEDRRKWEEVERHNREEHEALYHRKPAVEGIVPTGGRGA